MRLNRIDIHGFKSFRDRMTIELSDGMTAIVGPNGCGKSNVVDALKWAMGDMSPKSLRGQDMQDVIFAGSETAKPMGLAEVTLTFHNDGVLDAEAFGDSLPREFQQLSEIAITRRLHRSGDSEYLINKVACRLLDIQNLLAGTGLGKQGYSIIEQNQVGFIVSARPSERRLIIEEASGITRYKGQRDRTVRRLEKADENLQRVADILAEVEKQLRSLERQAQRASQYRRLNDELRELEIAILLVKRDELAVRREKVKVEQSAAEAEVDRALKAWELHETAIEGARVELFAAEKKQAEATETFYRAETRLNISKSKREHAVESLAEARRRLETATREITSQTDRRQRLALELAQVRQELGGMTVASEGQRDVQQQETDLKAARGGFAEADADMKRAKSSFDQQRADYLRMEDRAQWLKNQGTELQARETEHGQMLKQMTTELERWRTRHEAAVAGLVELETAANLASESVNGRSREVENASIEAKAARTAFQGGQRLKVDAETRLESLAAMNDRAEGFADGVQSVMDWAKKHRRQEVLGPLANLVRLPAAHVDAIGRAVGDQLSEILVTSQRVAIDAARGAKPKGRVVFRVVGETFDAQKWVDDLVKGLDFAKDIDGITSDPDVDIWVLDSGELILSDGRIIVGASVGNVEALVRRQQQIQELQGSVPKLEIEVRHLEVDLVKKDEVVGWLQLELETLRRAHDEARVAFSSSKREAESDQREVERVDKSLERHRSQLIPILRRKEELVEELERIATRKADFELVRDDLQRQVHDLDALTREKQTHSEQLHLALTERRVELAQTLERRRNLEESEMRIDRGLASTEALIQRYGRESDEARAKIVDLESALGGEGEDLVELDNEVHTRKIELDDSKKRAVAALDALKVLEAAVREKRSRLDSAKARVQALEVSERELALSIEHVDEQIRDGYDLSPAAARLARDTIEMPESEWVARRDYLRRRIEGLGPVNAMAEEEYTEAQERRDFLTEQKDDLERSASDLKKAIAEMDRESRRRFRETFESVNSKFQEIFPRLFRGGHARLILTDPDDMLATGVDIEVSPPGKRLQNVSLLSGGEKALTAVSLIFSIFLLKPTPFSVLDEVDAPLDEANVGRFAQMVKEMSATSQMIVITHSRRSMESADLLYGVTMETPGVSKIVSVRLSDNDPVDGTRVA
jgi:chromosome segregation protein